MNKSVSYVLLLLFLLNFIAGIAYLNEGLFHFDSVILAKAVEKTYKTGVLQPQVQGRYGSVLINLIVYLPFYLIGQNADLAVRVSSVLFHALSIVMFFLFIQEFFKNSVQAFFAALLLSFTPFYFQPGTYGKEHGASIFFVLLAFYLLHRGLSRKSLIITNLASLSLMFSVAIREAVLVLVPFFLLLYFKPDITLEPLKFSFPKERYAPKFLITFVAVFLLAFGVLFFTYLKELIYNSLHDSNSLGFSFFLGLTGQVFDSAFLDLFLSLPSVVFLLAYLGVIFMLREKRYFQIIYFILWFMLIYYLGNLSVYVARHLDIVVIPLYCFASYALYYLYAKNKILSYSLIVYLVLLMFCSMLPFLEFRHHYNGEKRFALYVRDHTPKDCVIIAQDLWVFIDYYGNRKVLKLPGFNQAEIDQFIRTVKKYLKDKTAVYIIVSPLTNKWFFRLRDAFLKDFDASIVGKFLNEDYHKPELKLNLYYEILCKVHLKEINNIPVSLSLD